MANLRVDKITSTETFETTGSVQFDGPTDGNSIATGHMVVSSSSDFAFGTGDFTVEMWVYGKDWTGGFANEAQVIYYHNEETSGFFVSAGELRYYNVSVGHIITGPTLQDSRWYHLAAVRKNGILTVYVDGINIGSATDPDDYGTSAITIGKNSGNNKNQFRGHISNFKILKGKALYTENFTPPTRELTVTPETVLLACQHKTDASHEKTGKTITVNGDAVASELTPGLLTDVVKSGGNSAITGSVEFDGTGDYLLLNSGSSDFTLGTDDFTIECWAYPTRYGGIFQFFDSSVLDQTTSGPSIGIDVSENEWKIRYGTNSTGDSNIDVEYNQWYHLAYVRNSSVSTLYLNGVNIFSVADSTNYSANYPVVGGWYDTDYLMKGFISNFRVIKGTALYTDNFIPPTRELKKVPGTVLLCCQDEDNVTTEATGKTITSNGDPAASNFTPQVGDDRKVTFEGVTKINTENYFYLPTGDTVTRDSRSGRGLFGGGDPGINTINYITIASMGNAQDFGDLSQTRLGPGSVASSTRAVFMTGYSGGNVDTMDYVTIATTGNALDFGNLGDDDRHETAGVSNQTRGMVGGGAGTSAISDRIDYITIASTGDSIDFGNLTVARRNATGVMSSTRGVFCGGRNDTPAPSTQRGELDYVTIASTGNALDFGDLTVARGRMGSVCSSVRGVVGGGEGSPADSNVIDYITIASTGNAQDFGDMINQSYGDNGGCSNSMRGVFGGHNVPAGRNIMEYVTISSTGNSQDFGDLTYSTTRKTGCSNGHGGLG